MTFCLPFHLKIEPHLIIIKPRTFIGPQCGFGSLNSTGDNIWPLLFKITMVLPQAMQVTHQIKFPTSYMLPYLHSYVAIYILMMPIMIVIAIVCLV